MAIAVSRAPAAAPAEVPAVFYGMSGQTLLPQSEHHRMKLNGVDSIRIGLSWNAIEPSPGVYDFSSSDPYVERATRAGLEIFPFLGATPTFYGVNCGPDDCFRSLPAQNAEQLGAWKRVVRAIWGRYGPNGSFWAQNPDVPRRPFNLLQAWNEENFTFFTDRRSPRLYAKLVRATDKALRSVDPSADVVLGGLFAHPKKRLGWQGVAFLKALYKVKGIKARFDGVALHPYAKDATELRRDIRAFRKAMRRGGDARTPLYLTELGFGSGHDTAFEKGIHGQVRELRQAYRILRNMQRSARIRRTYWFSWEDLSGSCNFCDTAGLVRENYSAKPALRAFRSIAGCFGRVPTILGTPGGNRLIGTPGNDVIVGEWGRDRIVGGGGRDFICAGPGRDLVTSGGGNDRLLGAAGNDRLFGHNGNDVLIGAKGNDVLHGNRGRDRLMPGSGRDRLRQ